MVLIELKNHHLAFQSRMKKIVLKAKSRRKTKYQNSAPMKRSVAQLINERKEIFMMVMVLETTTCPFVVNLWSSEPIFLSFIGFRSLGQSVCHSFYH